MPAWSLAANSGIDPGAASAFIAGFGIVEITFALIFCMLIALHMLKKLLGAAGF